MDKIKEYVDKLVKERVPYLDVIAFKDGKEIYRYYTARAGANGKEKLFLYSATKPITAVLTMRLIEEGHFSLSTPVSELLPEYADAFLLNENRERVPPKNKITVKHLLTMSAGLTYDASRYPIKETLRERGAMSETRAVASALVRAPLSCEPGHRFVYSLCHDVLGAVIEVASGMSFSAYMKKIVFDPLGMTETYFAKPQGNDVADIFTVSADGTLSPTEKNNSLLFSDGYESGGAGLISTVTDYARFARALSVGGAGILKAETLKQLYTPALDHLSVENSYTCVQGGDYGYGLGVRTRLVPTEWGLSIGEYGWDGAAGTYLMVDPIKRCAVVIGAHLLSWPYVLKGEHLAILKRIYEAFGI